MWLWCWSNHYPRSTYECVSSLFLNKFLRAINHIPRLCLVLLLHHWGSVHCILNLSVRVRTWTIRVIWRLHKLKRLLLLQLGLLSLIGLRCHGAWVLRLKCGLLSRILLIGFRSASWIKGWCLWLLIGYLLCRLVEGFSLISISIIVLIVGIVLIVRLSCGGATEAIVVGVIVLILLLF